MAVDVVETGPMESVLAKKMRSSGRRASGSTLVWLPGRGHIHGMAAAIDVHFQRIGVRLCKDTLHVREDPDGKVACAFLDGTGIRRRPS